MVEVVFLLYYYMLLKVYVHINCMLHAQFIYVVTFDSCTLWQQPPRHECRIPRRDDELRESGQRIPWQGRRERRAGCPGLCGIAALPEQSG